MQPARCDCKAGYKGRICSSCVAGYFATGAKAGLKCTRCNSQCRRGCTGPTAKECDSAGLKPQKPAAKSRRPKHIAAADEAWFGSVGAEASRLLESAGFGWLRLGSNGTAAGWPVLGLALCTLGGLCWLVWGAGVSGGVSGGGSTGAAPRGAGQVRKVTPKDLADVAEMARHTYGGHDWIMTEFKDWLKSMRDFTLGIEVDGKLRALENLTLLDNGRTGWLSGAHCFQGGGVV